jgi:hypothetical protein
MKFLGIQVNSGGQVGLPHTVRTTAFFLLGSFLVFLIVITNTVHQIGCVSPHRVGKLVIFIRFGGYSCRPPLPGRCWTLRIRHIAFGGLAQRFFSTGLRRPTWNTTA